MKKISFPTRIIDGDDNENATKRLEEINDEDAKFSPTQIIPQDYTSIRRLINCTIHHQYTTDKLQIFEDCNININTSTTERFSVQDLRKITKIASFEFKGIQTVFFL